MYRTTFSFTETSSSTSVSTDLLVAVIVPVVAGLVSLTLLIISILAFCTQRRKKKYMKLNTPVTNINSYNFYQPPSVPLKELNSTPTCIYEKAVSKERIAKPLPRASHETALSEKRVEEQPTQGNNAATCMYTKAINKNHTVEFTASVQYVTAVSEKRAKASLPVVPMTSEDTPIYETVGGCITEDDCVDKTTHARINNLV